MVVPNPVEMCADTSDPLPGESHRILFLGSIERRKGIFDLVTAVARLAPEFPDLKLAVAGTGQLHRLHEVAATQGAASHLEILGWITPEQRAQELKRAAVVALPSYNEGLPMAVLEGMAAGRPVLTTHAGGIPDVVHHEQEGLLVEAGDVDGLTAALGRLMRDSGLRQRLGRQARLTARAYSVDVVLERVSQIYESLGVELGDSTGPAAQTRITVGATRY
jgi:glycosyltransferase involved in cell wall biosynthesis